MKPLDIKIRLMRAGCTQTAIAKELGINPQSVHDVINKRTQSKRIKSLIAQKINLPEERVFD